MEIGHLLQQNLIPVLVVIITLFLFKNRILSKIYGIRFISLEDAFDDFKKKSAKTLFLDVRTKWELDMEPKIKNSIFIPLSELSGRMGELDKLNGRDKKIIVVCLSSSRARGAAIKLKKAGFDDVYVMSGGMTGWQRADYPVVRPKVKQSFS